MTPTLSPANTSRTASAPLYPAAHTASAFGRNGNGGGRTACSPGAARRASTAGASALATSPRVASPAAAHACSPPSTTYTGLEQRSDSAAAARSDAQPAVSGVRRSHASATDVAARAAWAPRAYQHHRPARGRKQHRVGKLVAVGRLRPGRLQAAGRRGPAHRGRKRRPDVDQQRGAVQHQRVCFGGRHAPHAGRGGVSEAGREGEGRAKRTPASAPAAPHQPDAHRGRERHQGGGLALGREQR